jgi:hypothetical protein
LSGEVLVGAGDLRSPAPRRKVPVRFTTRFDTLLAIAAGVIGVVTGGGSLALEPTELRFDEEIQNLRVWRKELRQYRPTGVRAVCETLVGDLWYGRIPHRLYDEDVVAKQNFLNFVVAYRSNDRPVVLVDFDVDHMLECEEEVALISNPDKPEELFRTLILKWRDDGGPSRQQRYRLSILSRVGPSERASYAIDLVDVPVARWSNGRHKTIWILYDGNYNGLYDRRFGDGILIDTTGNGRFNVERYGGNFFSYHAPIGLPWGTVEVVDVDPAGRSLRVRSSERSVANRGALREGDLVPVLECKVLDGSTVRLGGATGVHQLVFFWMSSCGSSRRALREITAVVKTIEPGRLSAVGVSMDEAHANAERVVRESLIEWPQCYSGRAFWDNELARRFEVRSAADFVLIGPEGRLVASGNGAEQLIEVLDTGLIRSR